MRADKEVHQALQESWLKLSSPTRSDGKRYFDYDDYKAFILEMQRVQIELLLDIRKLVGDRKESEHEPDQC